MTTMKTKHGIGSLVVYFTVIFSSLKSVNGFDTSVNVVTPTFLVRPNGYYHQSAGFEFARCPYNDLTKTCHWNAPLVYMDNTLCDPVAINTISIPSEPFLLWVGRGDCSLDVPAQNAQAVGAMGIVIADHTCLCSEGANCVSDYPCENTPPSLFSSSIPSILLQKQDGDAIQSRMTSEPVRMQVDWEVFPVLGATANIDYWHVPGPYLTSGQDIPLSLGRALEQMAETLSFTPKFAIQSGLEIGCHPDNATLPASVCLNRCTNNGRYCAGDPEGDHLEGVLGVHVVEEVLRRMCIWESYGSNSTDSIGRQYWSYLEAFSGACQTDSYEGETLDEVWADDSCSRSAMKEAGLDTVRVMRCVLRSGGTNGSYPNQYLDASISERPERLTAPSMEVNSVQFRSRTFAEVLSGICATYSSDSIPNYCISCMNCVEEFNCIIDSGFCPEQRPLETFTPSETQPAANGFPTPAPSSTGQHPTTEVPVFYPSTDNVYPGAENYTATIEPSNAYEEGDRPVGDPTQDQGQTGNSDEDDSVGLSDTDKVVIVLAVVGGAIVVVFGFVIFLVFKLLHRIRNLEKKDNKTPTTTSPAGSNIWDLPHYTGKEDPFNSDCDPMPPEIIEMSMQSVPEPVTQTVIEMDKQTSFTAPSPLITAPTQTSQAKDIESGTLAEPNRGVLVPHSIILDSKLTEEAVSADQVAGYESPATMASAGGGPDNPNKETDTPKPPKKSASAVDRHGNASKHAEKTKTPKKSPSVEGSNKSSKTKLRSSKQGPSLLDIMGKAAPEAKVPRSFSYEDEEKEEVANDWEGLNMDFFLDGIDKID